MIFPEDLERKLGFDRIRAILVDCCTSRHSADLARETTLSFDQEELEAHFQLLGEFFELGKRHPSWPAPRSMPDVRALCHYLSIPGSCPEEEQLHELRMHLLQADKLRVFLEKHQVYYPLLHEACGVLMPVKEPLAHIQAVLYPHGVLRENASALYGKLGKQVAELEQEVRRITLGVFQWAKNEGLTAETEITVREERLVIPLLAEHKKRVDGLVHDISARGRILYVEPAAAFEANNRLKQVYLDRRREKERILRETADKVRPFLPGVEEIALLHARLDVLSAHEALAGKLHAGIPQFTSQPVLKLAEARHPLLMLRSEKPLEQVVPVDVFLDEKSRMLIISGPNAGGKSIALKTIMLLQYMVQCGLPVPADQSSRFPVFRKLLLNLGDDQSIDNDLSTYSAHLRAMNRFLQEADEHTLLAIDELGTGTDPQIGGFLSEAVLEQLLASGAMAVVTTHFGNLKTFAERHSGVQNAAMAYDVQELKPLYRLVPGKPGSSFALELARKTGMPPAVLERTRALGAGTMGNMEELLLQLEQERNRFQKQSERLSEKEALADKLSKDYAQLKDKLEAKRQAIMEAARRDAAALLEQTNRQIEQTIRLIKETRADKEQTVKARKALDQLRTEVQPKKPQEKPKPAAKPLKAEHLLPGMKVLMAGTDTRGELIEVKKDKAYVAFGLVKTWVPLAQLSEAEPVQQPQHTRKSGLGMDWVSRHSNFAAELDLRGARGEEALATFSKWLDEAYALGQLQLRVIHGRGDGILRKLLREHMKSLPFIKEYKSEHADLGGDGATIIYLR